MTEDIQNLLLETLQSLQVSTECDYTFRLITAVLETPEVAAIVKAKRDAARLATK